jgi:sec-independent protein translocase protein TatB
MGLSLGEIMVIAIVGLIFIGPKELPRVMREIGRFIRKIKNTGDEFMRSIEGEMNEPKKYIKDLNGNLQETFTLDDLKK